MLTDWDAYNARREAQLRAAQQWWSNPWNNFWTPIVNDWVNNPGHALGGTLGTAATVAVPGGIAAKGASAAPKLTQATSSGVRFVGNGAGNVLDATRITIPEGKFGYLLENPSKSGVFRDSMGLDPASLERAIRNHLTSNFGSASPSVPMTGGGTKFTVRGPMTGPTGQVWEITTAWGVDADGTIRLITATP